MNVKRFYWFVIFAMSFSAKQALAVSDDYLLLLDNIVQKQPEQKLVESLKTIQSAQQSLSQSWIAGDIDLKIAHENDALTDNERQRNWEIGVDFPIFLPDQKQVQTRLSKSFQAQIPAQQDYLKWLASAKLRNLAWQYKIAEIETIAAQNALKQSQSLQIKVEKKVNAGESPQIDLLLANKEIINWQKSLVKQQLVLAIARKNFQTWTQSQKLPLDILETQANEQLLEQHPQIQKLNSALDVNQSQLQTIKSFKKDSPRLYLGAKNDRNRSNNNTALMFEVSIPLGFNPTYSGKVAQQKQNINQQQVAIDSAKIVLEQNVYQAKQKLLSAKQNIKLSEQQYQISQRALKMSEQAYQLGETDIQNLLLVQQQSLAAKLDYQLAKAKHGQAIAKFNQISGQILGAQ